jgi:hypothetical protein
MASKPFQTLEKLVSWELVHSCPTLWRNLAGTSMQWEAIQPADAYHSFSLRASLRETRVLPWLFWENAELMHATLLGNYYQFWLKMASFKFLLFCHHSLAAWGIFQSPRHEFILTFHFPSDTFSITGDNSGC